MKLTRAQKAAQLKARREAAVYNGVTRYRQRLAGLIAESRKLLGKKVYLADVHTHSAYSDGAGFVEDNAAWAEMAGLDYIFATDHGKTDPKRVVGKLPNAGWGEETGGGWYHIGILEPTPKHHYKNEQSLPEAWEELKALTRFQWLAHPFWAYEQPPEEQYQQVLSDMRQLGDMAMEIANGCVEVADAYFLTGAAGSRMVDELLCGGQRVTLLGVSDCHFVADIGTAWTGIYAARRTSKNLIDALAAGNCFASEAPLLDVSLNGKPMGSTLKPKPGAALKLRARIAAAAGIAFVKVISNGKVIKEIWPKHEPVVDLSLDRKATRKPTYFRIETADANGRRAFSTPIYVRP
ncbi:MAG: CehA/McbA family metallohydrolase [Planctomycetota bacterium]|jgi:hypothetical protein